MTVASEDGDKELEVLLAEYQILREDERHWVVVMGSFAGIALLIAGFTLSLLYQGEWKDAVPSWAYLLAPMPLAVVLGYLFHLSAPMPITSLYLRTLESRLWEYTTPTDLKDSRSTRVHHPSSSYLTHFIQSPRTGTLLIRSGQFIMYGFLAALFLAIVIQSLQFASGEGVSRGWIIASGVFYFGIAAWLLAATVSLMSNGRKLWISALQGFDDSASRSLGRTMSKPSRFAALVLPRKQELIKSVLPILAGVWVICTPAVATSDRGEAVVLLAGLVFAFELIFYQGRYLLNDLRDSSDDVQNEHRTRYPWHQDADGSRRALWTIGLRIAAIVAIVIWAPWPLAPAIGVSVLVSAVAAVVYDLVLRERTRRVRATEWRQERGYWIIYLWVGIGYGIRVATPIWMFTQEAWLIAFTFTFGAMLGSMFVSMTWGLEATTRPTHKAHVRTLEPGSTERPFSPFDKVLTYPEERGRMWDRFLQSLAIVAPATAIAVIAPVAGITPYSPALALIAVVALTLFSNKVLSSRWAWAAAFFVLALATVWALRDSGRGTAALGAAPVLGVLAVYTSFRWTSYRDLNHPELMIRGIAALARCGSDRLLERMSQTDWLIDRKNTNTEISSVTETGCLSGHEVALPISSARELWIIRDEATHEAVAAVGCDGEGLPRTHDAWSSDTMLRWFRDGTFSTVVVATTDGSQASECSPESTRHLPGSVLKKAIDQAVDATDTDHVLAFARSSDKTAMCALDRAGFMYVASETVQETQTEKRYVLFGLDPGQRSDS